MQITFEKFEVTEANDFTKRVLGLWSWCWQCRPQPDDFTVLVHQILVYRDEPGRYYIRPVNAANPYTKDGCVTSCTTLEAAKAAAEMLTRMTPLRGELK